MCKTSQEYVSAFIITCVYANCVMGPFPPFDPKYFFNRIQEIPQKHLFLIQGSSWQEQTTIFSLLTSPFLHYLEALVTS